MLGWHFQNRPVRIRRNSWGSMLMAAVALCGCAAPPPRITSAPPGSVSPPRIVRETEWEVCLQQEISAQVAKMWTVSASRGELISAEPTPNSINEIESAALERCVPGYSDGAKFVATVAQYAAVRIFNEQRAQFMARSDYVRTQRDLRRLADDQQTFKREEELAVSSYRQCIYDNAVKMALISAEPASSVVLAALAVCRTQREHLIDIHRRHGDRSFDSRIMDEIERRISGNIIAVVIQARAVQRQTPPTPQAPAQRPREHSI